MECILPLFEWYLCSRHVWTFDIPIYTEWITDPQVKYELDKSAAGTNIIDDKHKHIIHTEIQSMFFDLFSISRY